MMYSKFYEMEEKTELWRKALSYIIKSIFFFVFKILFRGVDFCFDYDDVGRDVRDFHVCGKIAA